MTSESPHKSFPEGTVTFLFTDIEGSTKLLKQLGDAYATVLQDHREILREAFNRWSGQEVDSQTESFFYAFPRATETVSAAVEAQRTIFDHDWPEGVKVRVRMGLHTGEPLDVGPSGYVGMAVHRAARIANAGHGGQVLLSATTAPLVRGDLQEGVSLLDLGEHRLKDLEFPERITQLVINGLPSEFLPPKSLEVLPVDDPRSLEAVHLPPFLEDAEVEPERPVFVARERELELLTAFLQDAIGGKGGVVFVTGGPGRGKTALLEEFGRQVIDTYSDLLVVSGECSAFRGVGDPYLPFRRMMAMLTGDVKTEWASGTISRENALRLWNTMPSSARAIAQYGPDLIGTFVSGWDMLRRVNAAVDVRSNWLERLGQLVEPDRGENPEFVQANLFRQFEYILDLVAADHPVVLILDDMQWADGATLDLLFHLGRRLKGNRILIVGAYRPEEVALGRDDDAHPLEKVLAEFKRQFGEVEVDLGKTGADESRQFVDAYIDNEHNRLSTEFRSALFAHTEGHPLFTVELLRNLQEGGDIVLDHEGVWVETGTLDWSVLPPRVEGVIEERIGRLDDELKETLTVASVEGVDFTVRIVAQVREVQERSLVRQLSQDLGKKHRLVQEHGIQEVNHERLYKYRFRHQLFQQHLYNGLGDFERTELHREVGSILEDVYGDRAREVAPQLAYHFTEAGESERALEYLIQAGDQARMVYANVEGIRYYRQALKILGGRKQREERARVLLKLGLVYTANFEPELATEAFNEAFENWDSSFQSELRTMPRKTFNILRLAVSEPNSLDPGKLRDDFSIFIANQLFEGLVTIDAEFNVLPAIASSWEVSSDGLRYIFNIRKGMKWSDGSDLNAMDFEYAWKRNIALREYPSMSHLLYVVKNARAYGEDGVFDEGQVGVSALDYYTLEVLLETPTAFLPHLLAHPVAAPLHRQTIECGNQSWTNLENIVTNGPFLLRDYEPKNRIVLQRNPYYQGRFPGNVYRVECPLITEYDSILDEYESGHLDAVDMIASDLGSMALAREKFPDQFFLIPQLSTFYLTFRNDVPPFSDVRVRQAFSHSIDLVRMVEETTEGMYLPASGGFIPPGMPAHSSDIGLPFNPGIARELLAQAGYPDAKGFPNITWFHIGGKVDNLVVPWLQDAWSNVLGIKAQTIQVTWNEFLERRETDPSHLAVSGYSADYPDPDNMLRVTFHSHDGINPPRWQNPQFDLLVKKATEIIDPPERLKLYQAADHILVNEETAVFPLYYTQGRALNKPWIERPKVPPSMLGLKEVMIEEE